MTPVQIVEEVRVELALKRIDQAEAVRRVRAAINVTEIGALDILNDKRPADERYNAKGATEQ